MKFQPNNTVICDLSALFVHGVSNFEPSKLVLKVKRSSLAHVKKKIMENELVDLNDYSLETQIDEFLELGVVEYNGQRIYSLDRLIIELDSIEMEPGVRSTVEREIVKKINFEKFRKLYTKFLKLKKFKVSKLSTKVYKENIETGDSLLAKLSNPKTRKSDVLREYIINNFVNKQNNDCIIKGGTAIQILLPGIDRATNDIDINSHSLSISDIKDSFTKGSVIWFKIYMLNSSGKEFDIDQDEVTQKIKEKMESNKVVKLRLEPVTRNGDIKKEIGNIKIDLSINFTFDQQAIREIESQFNIQKHELTIFKGNSVKTFSTEMIIGDKIQHIIRRKEEATRVKDLIDIVRLYEDGKDKIDMVKIVEWISLITSTNRESVLKELAAVKTYALEKYRTNFSDAMSMYNIEDNRSFDDYFIVLREVMNKIRRKYE